MTTETVRSFHAAMLREYPIFTRVVLDQATAVVDGDVLTLRFPTMELLNAYKVHRANLMPIFLSVLAENVVTCPVRIRAEVFIC